MYNILYIFIEGDDDERFFQRILIPHLRKSYDYIKLVPYANDPDLKVNQNIESINSMDFASIIFTSDYDQAPCYSYQKNKETEAYKHLHRDNIFIVREEIESWYAAGISEALVQNYKLQPHTTTDQMKKEEFLTLVPPRIGRLQFILQILGDYDLGLACKKNSSLNYFIEKYCVY